MARTKQTARKFATKQARPAIRRAGARWTLSEEQIVAKSFMARKTPEEIAVDQNRSVAAIKRRLKMLGLGWRGRPWRYDGTSQPCFTKTMTKATTKACTKVKNATLGYSARARWGFAEIQDLILKYKRGVPIEEIASAHGRTLGAIKARLELNQLGPWHTKDFRMQGTEPATNRDWESSEDCQLSTGFGEHEPLIDIARKLMRPTWELKRRLEVLGVVNWDVNRTTSACDQSLSRKFSHSRVDNSGVWTTKSTTLVRVPSTRPSLSFPVRILAFDLDDTLVIPLSGKVFSAHSKDWKWLIPKEGVRQGSENAVVAIISNQSTIGPDHAGEKAQEIKEKIDQIIADLGVPVYAVLATADDANRKPFSGSWNILLQSIGVNSKTDVAPGSLYVGDAAGRNVPTLAGRKKDFSCSDRKFAANIGVLFKTPEEFAFGSPQQTFSWDGLSPDMLREVLVQGSPRPKYRYHREKSDVVIMVGWPGSGKSTFFRQHLAPFGYEHVNRDTSLSIERCVEKMKEALQHGGCVCVDNTNPGVAERKRFVEVAQQFAATVRCFVMDTSREVAQHLNKIRTLAGKQAHVPEIAYKYYGIKYEPPSESEGFESIIKIPLLLDLESMSPIEKEFAFQLS